MTTKSEAVKPSANNNRELDEKLISLSKTTSGGSHVENSQAPPDDTSVSLAEDEDIDIEKTADSNDTSGSASRTPSEDGDSDGKIVIGFEENDLSNPYNWPIRKKMYVVIAGIILVLNSTMGSALPSGAIETIAKEFEVRDDLLLVLPVSIYLIGYILGPMVFAPLSESYGRKRVMIGKQLRIRVLHGLLDVLIVTSSRHIHLIHRLCHGLCPCTELRKPDCLPPIRWHRSLDAGVCNRWHLCRSVQ